MVVCHASMQDLPVLTAELILTEDSMFSPRDVAVVVVVAVAVAFVDVALRLFVS
jgi:hypothetical protein